MNLAPAMDLEREMRDVLAKLEVVSHGTTYSYSVVASKGGFGERDGGDGRPPGGLIFPPHEHWAREWNAADSDERRLEVLELASDELDRYTHRVLPEDFEEKPEQPHERTARLLRQGEGIPLHEAAYRLNVAPGELLRLRKRAGRDGYHGREPEQARASREERRARVRELKQRHPRMSNRQIADIVGCDHKTVAADLDRHDAASEAA